MSSKRRRRRDSPRSQNFGWRCYMQSAVARFETLCLGSATKRSDDRSPTARRIFRYSMLRVFIAPGNAGFRFSANGPSSSKNILLIFTAHVVAAHLSDRSRSRRARSAGGDFESFQPFVVHRGIWPYPRYRCPRVLPPAPPWGANRIRPIQAGAPPCRSSCNAGTDRKIAADRAQKSLICRSGAATSMP